MKFIFYNNYYYPITFFKPCPAGVIYSPQMPSLSSDEHKMSTAYKQNYGNLTINLHLFFVEKYFI